MTSGVPKTKHALGRRLAGQAASGASRSHDQPASPAATEEPIEYLSSMTRIRAAEARIKEARARKDEIANAKHAGELIDADLASDWSRRLVAAVLLESEGLTAFVDLMGLSPEVAAPLRSAATDLARRFRHRVAALPELTAPPKPGVPASLPDPAKTKQKKEHHDNH